MGNHVSYSHGVSADPRESDDSRLLASLPATLTRVGAGALRVQAGHQVAGAGLASYQHTEASLAETGSVMATRSGSGINETVEIAPGQRTNLATAARLGLIVSDGRGGYMDAPGKPRA
ncbi:hypothetical protein [Piscinibacterium candidicorallinum]|uniref:Uncharacterized protein n=1 Tax=Piscinibacterium candidicorallinum TaxID=1793872 RepID=A0ABV7H1P2_9BURK